METFFIKALQLVLSLSILIVVHELGHFLFARLFKIRVEKFYLFFDAGFSLFKFKPKKSDTEYGIGWLPLGGYCKISGMIDESMDLDQMKQAPQPWEFRTKPAWQRLLVMFGGVMFNLILALFIMSMIVFKWGDVYTPYKNFQDGMVFSQKLKNIGFQDGDILISADGEELNLYNGILSSNSLVHFFDAKQVDIIRNGNILTLNLPDNFSENALDKDNPPIAFRLFEGLFPAIVDSVMPESHAQNIGLQRGDSIVSINDSVTSTFVAMKAALGKYKDDSISIVLYRSGVKTILHAKLDSSATLGFTVKMNYPTVVRDNYSFLASFPVGINKGWETLKAYVLQTKYIFSKEGVKQLGGFATMGKMFSPQWDWQNFWTMTAFLSLALAFLNMLPIPMLDGGHIVYLLYEMITRRKPSDKFQEYAGMVGLFLILALLIISNGNDILRAIFGS